MSNHGIFPTNFMLRLKLSGTYLTCGKKIFAIKRKKKVSQYQIQSISVEFAINRMDQQHKAKVPVTARDPDN